MTVLRATQGVKAMPQYAKTVLTALAALTVAVIGLITSLGLVNWTPLQTTLVTAEAGTVISLITALTAHLWPGTPKEPVGLAATFTAVVTATIGLGNGFGWWALTIAQNSAVISVVVPIIGVGTALLARQKVTTTVPAAPEPDVGPPSLPSTKQALQS